MRGIWVALCCGTLLMGASQVNASYLSSVGNRLVDEGGNTVRLTGVNWFGFETSNKCFHGLWARDYQGVLRQVKQMGFNCLRIPWSNAILEPGARPSSINFYGSDPFRPSSDNTMNKELEGKTSMEILDLTIAACGELGLKVILDNHSREPDGYMAEALWYTQKVSHQQWINDWVTIAKRYKGNSTVIGFDLDNEPHGKSGAYAQWGNGDPLTDWQMASQECGNAILAENPDVLILIEGVEMAGTTTYWWGGNLSEVASHPVKLSKPEKLVYSPHEYGPEVYPQDWFSDAAFPQNLASIWGSKFGFINKEKKAPLLVGEFGIRDSASFQGRALTWFESFLDYMGDEISWTYWSLNPNSGDTGGLLKDDWLTEVKWKTDRLKPFQAPLIGQGTSVNERRAGRSSPTRLTYGNASQVQNGMTMFTIDGRRVNRNDSKMRGVNGIYLLYNSATGECTRMLDGPMNGYRVR